MASGEKEKARALRALDPSGNVVNVGADAAGQLKLATATGSATVTGVASAITSAVLKAANANRKGLVVHNNSTAVLYLNFAATAATIASGGYSVSVPAGAMYELPKPVYTGDITAIWAAANGYANVTELA